MDTNYRKYLKYKTKYVNLMMTQYGGVEAVVDGAKQPGTPPPNNLPDVHHRKPLRQLQHNQEN